MKLVEFITSAYVLFLLACSLGLCFLFDRALRRVLPAYPAILLGTVLAYAANHLVWVEWLDLRFRRDVSVWIALALYHPIYPVSVIAHERRKRREGEAT